jgi:predicted nucleic acid-binding protein
MKPLLYLETTIPSYLTSRPSRDLIVAARQQITRDWWQRRRNDFRVFASQIVLDEAAEGDRQAATARLSAIKAVALLAVNEEVISLTQRLLKSRVLPKKATRDAAHVAVAAVHGMHYLLTWNCTHLANAEMFEPVGAVCANEGYRCPIICTPAELLGE